MKAWGGSRNRDFTALPGSGEPYENSGYWQSDSPPPPARKTVLVVGLGRSGTSMVASVLQGAGVFMGETDLGTYEDPAMARAIVPGAEALLKALIQERDQAHATWGFKLPSRHVLRPALLARLRQPRVIVVFRDLLAITGRRQVSRHSPLLQEMTTAIREHQRLVRFIASIEAPTLLISYEKALLDPAQLVIQLDRFLDLALDPSQRRRSAERVEPSPDLYRREVRLPVGWLGRLETVRRDHIAGWAFRENTATGPGVRVEIFVNGNLLGRIPTTKPRLDVQRDHHLSSDRCGFCVDLRAPSLLKPGDVVSVTVEGEQEQLLNSPWRLGDSPP